MLAVSTSAAPVVSTAAAAVPGQVPAEGDALLEQALRLVDQGDAAGALEAIGPASGSAARDPRLGLVRAVLLKGLRRWSESLAAYDGVLGADPKNAEAWRQKGECLRFLGRTAEARRCLEMSVSLLPDQAGAWVSLARCNEATGSDQQALACWERAVTSSRGVECGWWVAKAECETRLGRDSDAVASYRAFLTVAPTSARHRATRVRSALATLVSPPPPEVLHRAAEAYRCAEALMGQGRWQAALGAFGDSLRMVARAPGLLWVSVGGRPVELQAAALSNMGMCFEQTGRVREALLHYRRALGVDSTSALLKARVGSCLVRLGRFREAARRLDGALRLEACPAEALHDHAYALWRLGLPHAALRSLEEWLALAPADAEAWNLRGCLLAEVGLASEAVASLDRALSLRPDSHEARCNRDRLAS